MSEQNMEWPEIGDLVIATIKTVMDYGVYANLDEYNKKGFLHISEISSARIRNIRDFVRENQKMVLKVLRVNVEKGHIDLSLRRVTKRERIEKIKSWKKERKGDALLYAVGERAGLSKEEIYQKVGAILEEKIGIYDGFENAVKDGPESLVKYGISEDLAKLIAQVADERIKIKTVTLRGVLVVRCMKPNGVRCIKEAFFNAKKANVSKGTKIEFAVIAAPKYRVEVSADNWKTAENLLKNVTQSVVENITSVGGHGEFKAEK
jgi:translation initiation factor 2 subunit 1